VEDDGADPTAVKILLLLLLSRDGRTVRDRQRRRPRREVDRRPAAPQRAEAVATGRRPAPRPAEMRMTARTGSGEPERRPDRRRRATMAADPDEQGLLLHSRERIDDGGRQMAPDGEKKWVSAAAAAATQT